MKKKREMIFFFILELHMFQRRFYVRGKKEKRSNNAKQHEIRHVIPLLFHTIEGQ